MSDITEDNGMRIKALIFDGLQDPTTTSHYEWRREIPAKKDHKLLKIEMNRLASNRFLPNKLGNWLQKSHNVEI